MDNQQQINNITRNLGRLLIDNGIKFIQSAFHLSPVVYSAQEIRNFLNQYNFPSISLSDEKYYIIDWNDWLNIIETDWIGEHQYMSDKFDCDNFAINFSSYASYVFDINSAGTCYGQVFDKNTNNFLAGHAFNLIIALKDGKLTPILYEPMTRNWCVWQKGSILGNWRYEINWILLF